MHLYLLRHAEAAEAPRDEDRELTAHGHDQAHAVAAGIAGLGLHIDTLLSSPLPRAVQTAQPVGDALGPAVELSDPLTTNRAAGDVLTLLADVWGRAPGSRVLLVGHEPQLSRLLLHVTGGRVHVRKALLAAVDVLSLEPPYGTLEWLLTWRHLKAIGHGATP